jgi:hypothetical protein
VLDTRGFAGRGLWPFSASGTGVVQSRTVFRRLCSFAEPKHLRQAAEDVDLLAQQVTHHGLWLGGPADEPNASHHLTPDLFLESDHHLLAYLGFLGQRQCQDGPFPLAGLQEKKVP